LRIVLPGLPDDLLRGPPFGDHHLYRDAAGLQQFHHPLQLPARPFGHLLQQPVARDAELLAAKVDVDHMHEHHPRLKALGQRQRVPQCLQRFRRAIRRH